MIPQKAQLYNKDTHEAIPCLINPTDFTEERSVTVSADKVKGKNVPRSEFSGGNPRTLTMKLLLDCFEEKGKTLVPDLDRLYKLTLCTQEKNPKTGRGRPPICYFQWGTYKSFDSFIMKLSIQYTLFRANGDPVRATVSLTLQEFMDAKDKPKQNPTSFSPGGRTLRTVRSHDTLALIAYEEYGDPTLWRAIAVENRIEDPMDLQPGRVLAIPPRS